VSIDYFAEVYQLEDRKSRRRHPII